MAKAKKVSEHKEQLKEADACTGLGVGVGVLGSAAAAAGAVCPICFVVAPALVGAGIYKRTKIKREVKEDK